MHPSVSLSVPVSDRLIDYEDSIAFSDERLFDYLEDQALHARGGMGLSLKLMRIVDQLSPEPTGQQVADWEDGDGISVDHADVALGILSEYGY